MMPSKSETVLQALEAALTGALPSGAKLLRNAYCPSASQVSASPSCATAIPASPSR